MYGEKPPHYFWNFVQGNDGMDYELFRSLVIDDAVEEGEVTRADAESPEGDREIRYYFDMGDNNRDGYLDKTEFYALYH